MKELIISGQGDRMEVDIVGDENHEVFSSELNKEDFTITLHIGSLSVKMLLEHYEQFRDFLWRESNNHIGFSKRECQVLRQFFKEMKLENGRTVLEEFAKLEELPYVKNFKPTEQQIRLNKQEFLGFGNKIREIINAPERQ